MADAELDKILGEIRKGIVQAMHEVERGSRDIFAEHAEEDVYKPYDDVRETYQYERRGKGPGGAGSPLPDPGPDRGGLKVFFKAFGAVSLRRQPLNIKKA